MVMKNPLDEYLSANNITDRAFGDVLGCTATSVYRYRKNYRRPRDDIKELIAEVTKGRVMPSVWFKFRKTKGEVTPNDFILGQPSSQVNNKNKRIDRGGK